MSRIHEALQKADHDRKLLRAARNGRDAEEGSDRHDAGSTSVADYDDLLARGEFESSNEEDEKFAGLNTFASSRNSSPSKLGSTHPTIVFENYLHRFLSKHRSDSGKGLSLAVTSVNAGDGVTFVTQNLANALHNMSVRRVFCVDETSLNQVGRPSVITVDPIVPGTVERSADAEAEELEDYHDDVLETWGTLDYRRNVIWKLCSKNDVLLVDCPPLRKTRGALPIASLVDGVVLVVQAGSTTKQDILFAERAILEAGGSFEGFILNEAPPALPSWLSNKIRLR
jgi:Mrp family chromosome partitioning ATPase